MFRLEQYKALEMRLEEIKKERMACAEIIAKHKSAMTIKTHQTQVDMGYGVEILTESELEAEYTKTHPEYSQARARDAALAKEQFALEAQLQKDLPQYAAKAHAEPFNLATQDLLQYDLEKLIALYQAYLKQLEKTASENGITAEERKAYQAGKPQAAPAKQDILAKLHHLETIGKILHAAEPAVATIQQLEVMLGDPHIRAAISQPSASEDNPHKTRGGKFLKNMDDEMATIIYKLANFVMPGDMAALDCLVIKKMTQLSTHFLRHVQAKILPLLAKLPDDVMMEIESQSISVKNPYPLQVTHQFQTEKEPWRFRINTALVSKYMDAFKDNDKYLLKKLDAVIHMLDCLKAERVTDTDKVKAIVHFFATPVIKNILLAHKKEVHSLFHEQKASEEFVWNMMRTIAYERKMAAILAATNDNNAAVSARKK